MVETAYGQMPLLLFHRARCHTRIRQEKLVKKVRFTIDV